MQTHPLLLVLADLPLDLLSVDANVRPGAGQVLCPQCRVASQKLGRGNPLPSGSFQDPNGNLGPHDARFSPANPRCDFDSREGVPNGEILRLKFQAPRRSIPALRGLLLGPGNGLLEDGPTLDRVPVGFPFRLFTTLQIAIGWIAYRSAFSSFAKSIPIRSRVPKVIGLATTSPAAKPADMPCCTA